MDGIQALLRLAVIFLTASLDPAPQPFDPTVDVRMPLLSQQAGASDGAGLEGVARWQQGGDELPSDLPDATDGIEEEPLDAPLEGEVDDEFLDIPLDEETLDAPLAQAQEEPLDAPLDEGVPLDDVIDLPVEEPAPLAEVPAAPVAAPAATFMLPEGFGEGSTIVRIPPAGETAEVPADCDVLVENGRAVVGSGCGAGDGPSWLSQIAVLPQSAPASSVRPASGFPVAEPSSSSPFGAGFPFDDEPSSSPFAESFPFDDGGVVITEPAPDVEPVTVISGSGPDDEDDDRVGQRLLTADDEHVAPGARFVPPLDEIDELRPRAANRNADNDGRRPPSPTPRADQTSERHAAQPARPQKKPKAKKKLNPCQTAKKVAKNPKSKRQLERARAKCRQYKKAKRQARTDSRPAIERRVA